MPKTATRRVIVGATGVMLLVAGCGSPSDYSEIITFTDEHGRACTATVVVDQETAESDDHEVTALDCDYPPEGERPGPESRRSVPDPE
jgi:hypothetical protein